MYMLWLYKEAQLSQSIKKATTRDDYHYNYHIIIIISVSIFLSISQELQGKCKPLLFEAQQQSITNYIPPVECIFYSLPGFWIRCFSCYGKVVRILQCDFVQASISLNKRQ